MDVRLDAVKFVEAIKQMQKLQVDIQRCRDAFQSMNASLRHEGLPGMAEKCWADVWNEQCAGLSSVQ